MSTAARPKRWDVSRQAKGREFDPIKLGLSALVNWRGVLLRVPGMAEGKRNNIQNEVRLMDQTTNVNMNSPHHTILHGGAPPEVDIMCWLKCRGG
jgi:hypothetical protein